MFHDWFFGAEFIFGLIGCWLLVVLSKWIGKAFLQRSDDYYDRKES